MKNLKFILMIIVTILFVVLGNKVIYAVDNFCFDEEMVNVELNGSKYLWYSGGSGTITWTSSDTNIATVENGNVKGLKIGKTTITATRGEESATCEVNVVYGSLTIGANQGERVSKVNLFLKEHNSEKLYATIKDAKYEKVSNVPIKWESSDSSIVSINESTGVMTANKAGKATITASAAGVSNTCEVTVYDTTKYTDFSNAKYETNLEWNIENLKISNITLGENENYYYIITSTNDKPSLSIANNGSIDDEKMGDKIKLFNVNRDENYIYTRSLAEFTELNKDLYLWVIQEKALEDWFCDENSNGIGVTVEFVVEGKKLDRTPLPALNLILQSFSIWGGEKEDASYESTHITFNFPSVQEKRNFTLKIGKVTDNAILAKIQNNDYSGITDLLKYAKNNQAVYTKSLTTTRVTDFRTDEALFDGTKLLQNKAYYYIYAEFDDEGGKYYPIEGVTLGQAYISSSGKFWDLYAYTSSDFKWDGLTVGDVNTDKSKTEETGKKDPEEKPSVLPYTGISYAILGSVVIVAVIGFIGIKKYNWYNFDIK